MSINAEREITGLWSALKNAQKDIGRTYYRWREAAIEVAGPDVEALDVGLKAAEVIGADIGKSFLPRLNWLKGEEAWLMNLARSISRTWSLQGAIVKVEAGENPTEVLIKWERCPWPTYAKQYGVDMEEDVLTCDRILETILKDVNIFFNVQYEIETLKAIPRGQGMCVRRLYKA
jgi:hypothetical protein